MSLLWKDRRRSERFVYRQPTVANLGPRGTYPVEIRDVSERGIRLLSVRRVPPESQAEVRLAYPGVEFSRQVRVKRCEKTPAGYLLAGEFVSSMRDPHNNLQRYVEFVRRVSRGIRRLA